MDTPAAIGRDAESFPFGVTNAVDFIREGYTWPAAKPTAQTASPPCRTRMGSRSRPGAGDVHRFTAMLTTSSASISGGGRRRTGSRLPATSSLYRRLYGRTWDEYGD